VRPDGPSSQEQWLDDVMGRGQRAPAPQTPQQQPPPPPRQPQPRLVPAPDPLQPRPDTAQ
jgi:hypothetical protein